MSHCAFRIASEGLPLLLPYVTKQIVHASRKDFKLLLSQKKAHFTSFTGSCFTAGIEALLPGCCIVILDGGKKVFNIWCLLFAPCVNMFILVVI